ncbi:MAG: hypothetical protein WC643_03425 [Parcubacteria group bacterium]|jgi:hypothetical protein
MNNAQLDFFPPFRLIGMSWILLLAIFFLPNQIWGLILKIILGFFLFVVVYGSFHKMWEEYVTMGAFVTMQTMWFAGFLWTPMKFWYFNLLFAFLIVLGIKTKIYQIRNINKGLGPKINSVTNVKN